MMKPKDIIKIKPKDLVKTPFERRSARKMDKEMLALATDDPDIEIVYVKEEAVEPNAAHGSNTPGELNAGFEGDELPDPEDV